MSDIYADGFQRDTAGRKIQNYEDKSTNGPGPLDISKLSDATVIALHLGDIRAMIKDNIALRNTVHELIDIVNKLMITSSSLCESINQVGDAFDRYSEELKKHERT